MPPNREAMPPSQEEMDREEVESQDPDATGDETGELHADCFAVDAAGQITNFYNTKEGCALSEFLIPVKKGSVVITAIGEYAFQSNQLTSLTIGNSVETIGFGAFKTNLLTKLTIPNNVTLIEGYAFDDNSIETVILDPNPILTFVGNSFRYNFWGAYNGADRGKPGTWTWDNPSWTFTPKP